MKMTVSKLKQLIAKNLCESASALDDWFSEFQDGLEAAGYDSISETPAFSEYSSENRRAHAAADRILTQMYERGDSVQTALAAVEDRDAFWSDVDTTELEYDDDDKQDEIDADSAIEAVRKFAQLNDLKFEEQYEDETGELYSAVALDYMSSGMFAYFIDSAIDDTEDQTMAPAGLYYNDPESGFVEITPDELSTKVMSDDTL